MWVSVCSLISASENFKTNSVCFLIVWVLQESLFFQVLIGEFKPKAILTRLQAKVERVGADFG